MPDTTKPLAPKGLPYRKLSAYRAERDWRMVPESLNKFVAYGVTVPKATIYKVALNPWLPLSWVERIRKTVRKIEDFEKLTVDASWIRKNEK